MKRILSLILASFLIFSTLFSVNVFASSNIKINGVDIGYTAGEYFSKNGKACTCHNQNKCVPEKNGCNCTHVNGTAQCYAFALWCQNKLFGYNDVSNGNKFKSIASVSAGNLTESKIKELISTAPIGAHIRTNGTAHSMILVSKNNKGFTIAQANGSNNNEYSSWQACRIGTATYTWKSYVNSTYGKRGIKFINVPKNYEIKKSADSTKTQTTTISWPSTKNIKTYVISTENNTTVYKTATSTAKYGTIYATDLITINGYSGSRLKVTYPVSGGTKTGYIDRSAVTSSKINVANAKKTASSKITAYRRSSGNAELGYISKGDVYYEIATKNTRTQVIYPISGGYKMGWIKK